MNALADRLKTIPLSKYLAYSALITGTIWTALGLFFLGAMIVFSATEGQVDPVVVVTAGAMLVMMYLVFVLSPGVCGILFGYKLLQQPTVNRIEGALTPLVLLVGFAIDAIAFSGFNIVFSVKLTMLISMVCGAAVAVLFYTSACQCVVKSEGLGSHRRINFVTKPVLIVMSIVVWMFWGDVYKAYAPSQYLPGVENDHPMEFVGTFGPVVVAIAFYFHAQEYVTSRQTLHNIPQQLPPSLENA